MTPTTGTVALDDPAYRDALHDIARVHDDLCGRRDALARTMRSVLDGGWSGVAADEFAAGWADWEAGCGAVLRGLADLHVVLGSVRRSLLGTDLEQGGGLDRVAARLGSGS